MWSVLGIPMCVNEQDMCFYSRMILLVNLTYGCDTVPFTTPNMMAPRMKRARTAASAAAATPECT